QNISALAQLAAGLAIAAGGGDTGAAGAAIAAGKNAVENNALAQAAMIGWRVLRPGTLGQPVTITALDVLVGKGLSIAEAESFLTSLTFEQRKLIDLALADPIGDSNFENAVLKTYEIYGASHKNEGYPIPEPLPPLPGSTIQEQDKDDGKLVTPIAQQNKDDGKLVSPIVEQDKNSGIFEGPEIDVVDWRDFILTNQNKSFVDYKGDLNKGDQIDLSKFTNRQRVSGGKANYVDPKTGWILSPDRAGANSHGGSAWKLTNKKGNRIATLDENGSVLRK
ncbi:VENN motif pre-toxin domain-containing protein, partial [Gilliamella sp. B2923]|uniref:VENN motif pre-toxin domain-containing protein n=1 Tax=Gilliamella sp. B2923 TaxID=2818005 RepID=UPI002269BFAA